MPTASSTQLSKDQVQAIALLETGGYDVKVTAKLTDEQKQAEGQRQREAARTKVLELRKAFFPSDVTNIEAMIEASEQLLKANLSDGEAAKLVAIEKKAAMQKQEAQKLMTTVLPSFDSIGGHDVTDGMRRKALKAFIREMKDTLKDQRKKRKAVFKGEGESSSPPKIQKTVATTTTRSLTSLDSPNNDSSSSDEED